MKNGLKVKSGWHRPNKRTLVSQTNSNNLFCLSMTVFQILHSEVAEMVKSVSKTTKPPAEPCEFASVNNKRKSQHKYETEDWTKIVKSFLAI